MKDKPYMIDDEPVSAKELIDAASVLDKEFAREFLKRTSVAAGILRQHGHTVSENPEFDSAERFTLRG